MSQAETPSKTAQTWDEPGVCPFCMATLEDPGAGFMRHLEESPVCAEGFENWRDAVARDMRGGWGG